MYASQYMPMQERFPYVAASDYKNLNSIVQAFPHLKSINKQFNWAIKPNVIGVVIRSANDDNVHKAIKYGVWTTTQRHKSKLNQLFLKAKSQNKQIYLFFSVVKSGMFEGVAKMTSNFVQEIFPYWWDDFSHKFKDYFKIQWAYIKDVNFNHFEGLRSQQSQEVVNSKDCQIVDGPTTQKMLQKFSKKPIKNKWIFNDFEYMDQRQRQHTRKNQMPYQSQYDYPYQMMNYMGYPQINVGSEQQSIPLPPQMFKPLAPQNRSDLGFQKNPVSKNRKK